MSLKYFMRLVLTVPFWSGFGMAVVLFCGIAFVMFHVHYEMFSGNADEKNGQEQNQNKNKFVGYQEVVSYAQCKGYVISVTMKKDILNSKPRPVNFTNVRSAPKELLEYLNKVTNYDGIIKFDDIMRIKLPCQIGKEIVYNKITDYYDISITVYGATSKSVEDVIRYPGE
jgi:hypothetical protein